ncbi:MAG: sigma-70 family RNA polymerase sigma factor [Oscillospiraceae bacterium]|nr:sigma-70 family RNA polymerase sigma factor [Oscillospiraceae bacterium]
MGKNAVELSARELVDKYSSMIYRLAYVRLNSNADAEDITQEVLLKYIRADKKFKDEEHRKAWLLKVTANAVVSHIRSQKRSQMVDLEEIEEVVAAPENKHRDLKYVIEQLPEKYRMVIHMFYYEELSIKEISEITGDSEGTVKSQLSRGRDKLKKLLEEGADYE